MYHMLMLKKKKKKMLKLGEIRFGSQLNGHMDRMILSQGGNEHLAQATQPDEY